MSSLGNKTLVGFFWTFVSTIGVKSITLTVSIILARILQPSDFGIIAMLMIFFSISQSFVNSGFSQALIRENVLTENDKGTVFWLNIIVALACYAGLWFAAPAISKFYNNISLIQIIRFMGLSIIFQSLSIVQTAVFMQRLQFRKLMVVSVLSAFTAGIISIYLAYQDFGVWSLAWNYIILSLVTSILLFMTNPWYPKVFFVKESFNRLFSFGSKLFLAGLLNTFYDNVYKVLIGRYYSAALLGFYTQAQQYVDQVTQSAVSTIQTVTYPILSKVRAEPARLKEAYKKILLASSFAIFPLVIGLGLLAEPFILTLVGEKWRPAIPFLQILCVSGALYHMHSINLNVLKVMGRSDLFLKVEIMKKLLITISIIIGIQFGIWGLLISSVISSYASLAVNAIYVQKLIKYSIASQIRDILPITLYTVPMAISIVLFKRASDFPPFVSLALGVLLGTSIYLLTAYFSKAPALKIIVTILASKFRFLKKITI